MMSYGIASVKTMDDAKRRLLQEYKRNFFTSTDKVTDWTEYEGMQMSEMNPNVYLIFQYGYDLFMNCLLGRNKTVTPDAFKEVLYWENNSALCIHVSTIIYQLLKEENIYTEKEMILAQGYYYHKTMPVTPFSMFLGEEHIGMHAWLSIKGSVVDMTIGQQKDFFAFKNAPYIVGEVPDKLFLVGKNEPSEIVNKYIERFAKAREISKEEWILRQVEYFKQWKKDNHAHTGRRLSFF